MIFSNVFAKSKPSYKINSISKVKSSLFDPLQRFLFLKIRVVVLHKVNYNNLFIMITQLKKRTLLWVLTVATILLTSTNSLAQTSSNTAFAEYYTISGKYDYQVIGNSEISEITGGSYNCGNDAATSRTLTLPAGATVVKAYVHWYGMVRNTFNTGAVTTYQPLGNISFQGPGGTAQTLNATSRPAFSAINGTQSLWFEAKKVDVTSILQGLSNPSGSYTVNVTGGHATACVAAQANVRAWTLTVVYTNPNSPAQKIYLYDGLRSIYQSTNTSTVSGYIVPSGTVAARTGTLTSVFLQGDSGIAGESCTTSDTAFPDYATNFANSSSGGGLDIDALSGPFTANSTSLNIVTTTTGDLIVAAEHVIKIPSICFAGNTAPALSATTRSNSCPTLTTSLNTITASNLPANTSLTFHSSTPANDANKLTVAQAGAVSTSGIYYAAIFDTNGLCYSPTSAITVTINPCLVATADTFGANAT